MTAPEAIVLAAGDSTRLGRPKALLALDGATLLAHVLATLQSAGVERGAVVLGESADEILTAVETAPLCGIRNPQPEAGRTGSLQVGLRVVPLAAPVLLWPVDRPFASPQTVRALLAAGESAAENVGWIVPLFQGGRGHPVLLLSRALEAVRAATPAASLRDVLSSGGGARLDVPVEDAGIHWNVDTEEDWQRALAWWRSRSRRD